jgi:curved DNA-binding protein CbpA
MQRTYYEILGVPSDASSADIRRQFRELARKYHPDVQRDKEYGHRTFVLISEAYHVLCDPTRRADYDLKLRDQARRQAGAGGFGTAPPPGGAGPGGRPGPASGPARPGAGGPGAPSSAGSGVGSSRSGTGPYRRTPGPAGARGPGLPNIPLLLRQAQAAYARGRFRDAIHLCQTVLGADRRNGSAYNILGDIYRVQGRVEQAVEMYSLAIQANPRDVTAETKLNRLLAQERSAARGASTSTERATTRSPQPTSHGVPDARRQLNQRMLVGSAGFALSLFFLLILNNLHGPPLEAFALISQWTVPMLWVMVLDGAIIGAVLSLTGLVRRMDEELIFPSLTRGGGMAVPIGLILFVTGALFFYLAGVIYVLVAALQDSFSASVLKVLCATLSLVCAVALLAPPEATRQVLLFGGNVVFVSMLVGWLLGDLFRPQWS